MICTMPASDTTPATPVPGEVPPAFRGDPVARNAFLTAISKLDEALTVLMVERMPPVLARALVTALADTRLMCVQCAIAKAEFNRVHGDALQLAWHKACQAAGVEPGSPESLNLQPAMIEHLPAELQPDPENPVDPARWSTGYPEHTRRGECIFHLDLAVRQAAAQRGTQEQPAQPPAAPRPILLAHTANVAAAAAEASAGMPPGTT